ncbi:hypothetical protein Syun_013856 [Stephania yunnanensis]|uniref:Uncharacterized protein n=1 Tax=Stephania yunnanensis TaxID=152371 RepID=A0AAP0JI75_9MAGN
MGRNLQGGLNFKAMQTVIIVIIMILVCVHFTASNGRPSPAPLQLPQGPPAPMMFRVSRPPKASKSTGAKPAFLRLFVSSSQSLSSHVSRSLLVSGPGEDRLHREMGLRGNMNHREKLGELQLKTRT